MESMNPLSKIRALAREYKHAIWVLLIGLGLMLLPLGSSEDDPVTTEAPPQTYSGEEDLETRLEHILSRISGAGETEVLLTIRTGGETLYQTNEDTDTSDSQTSRSVSTVIVDAQGNLETGLIRRSDPPVYQGAVVVCRGGDDPAVRLAVVEAVSCVTGLGADQITVVKMK